MKERQGGEPKRFEFNEHTKVCKFKPVRAALNPSEPSFIITDRANLGFGPVDQLHMSMEFSQIRDSLGFSINTSFGLPAHDARKVFEQVIDYFKNSNPYGSLDSRKFSNLFYARIPPFKLSIGDSDHVIILNHDDENLFMSLTNPDMTEASLNNIFPLSLQNSNECITRALSVSEQLLTLIAQLNSAEDKQDVVVIPAKIPVVIAPPTYEGPSTDSLSKEVALTEKIVDRPAYEMASFDDFAGIDGIIDQLRSYQLIQSNPELCSKYDVPIPGAILLYGPGGVGKTQLAEAFSNEARAEFRTVKGSDIVNMWVGESAKKLSEIFKSAISANHDVVLFFDEFDGVFSNNATGNAGVASSLISEMKNWLIEVRKVAPHVTVIGACNTIDNFDPALLRPGRFDTVIPIGLPNQDQRALIFSKDMFRLEELYDLPQLDTADLTPEQVFEVLQAEASGINIETLAQYTDGFSGADIKAILTDARRKKMFAVIAEGGRSGAKITQREILAAIDAFKKSRSQTS